MDVGLVNMHYVLARYLRLFASWRKRMAMISRGNPRPERQQVAMAGALEVAEVTLDVDEGDQAIPTPIHASQPPATGPTRTMEHRLGRLEDDVHGLRGALGEQREVLDSMARDFLDSLHGRSLDFYG
nr:hypothetical protein [Tanacetum cinerariifolium]